jgi:hypothetical protein
LDNWVANHRNAANLLNAGVLIIANSGAVASALATPHATNAAMQQFSRRSGLDNTREPVEVDKAVLTLAGRQVEAWIISVLEAVERCRSMERDALGSKDIEKR